jgi:hypothetical protein
VRTTLLAITALLAIALLPGSASAATCSDYSNQAEAQRAADTKDADGDGIYCESLPCPCLKPGGGGGQGPPAPPPPPPSAASAPRCGKERWSVKTLTDKNAGRVNFTPTATTVDALRALPAPPVAHDSPRFPVEFATYQVPVRLRAIKLEKDSDVHLVVADPTNATHTMIVEFPNAACVRKARPASRRRMARARRALLRSCGAANADSFRQLRGTATITGVAFFDVLHGQRGVAPNGIELHPVLRFTPTSRCSAR